MAASAYETVDPAFTIRIDPARKFVDIAFRGFWSKEDFAKFNVSLRQMLPNLRVGGCAIGDQVTIFDLSLYQVQG